MPAAHCLQLFASTYSCAACPAYLWDPCLPDLLRRLEGFGKPKLSRAAHTAALEQYAASAISITSRWGCVCRYGYKPNELVVKRLAVMGCTALVLANSIKESKLKSSYAGECMCVQGTWQQGNAAVL